MLTMKNKATTVVVTLSSSKYRSWTRAQEKTLARWAPEVDYRVVTEEEIRSVDMFTQYGSTEQLLFANRPKVVRMLLNYYDQVILVGADVYFTGPFLRVINADNTSDAIGVPHTITPLPDDCRAPTNLGVHRTGFINADFTVWRRSQEVYAFLDWQARQLERECVNEAHGSGLFFDQVWLGFAPYFIQNFKILRHPGFNVAYYNLHERELSHAEEVGWLVNGLPMYFFQFSGFDDARASTLSKYNGRPELQTMAVALLMKEFKEQLDNVTTTY